MKFERDKEYIELHKLLKVMGIAESGVHVKMLIEEENVKRNGEEETQKRAKIVPDEKINVGGDVIAVLQT